MNRAFTFQMVIMVVVLMFSLFGCGKTGQVMDGDDMEYTPASLNFESFDGGGPGFNVVIADESIVSYSSKKKYRDPDHEEMDGADYDVIIAFTGKKPGETTVIIEERSPIADNIDHKYRMTVDDELNVQIEQLSHE